MIAEVPGEGSSYDPQETEPLEALLLSTLEEHDGLCLDNEAERVQLAATLTQVLISAIRDGTINPIFLPLIRQ
jgi:hypothetical protein